ncbi:MAG: dihydrolipoyl dehydrogenase [Nitrospinae bacterium]|nr:dihydrolipoyl dehydrogenase [Nitrospinota bacterium]
MKKYTIAIIGAGPGGYVAAVRAAQLGAKVCLVEKERVGGTCLHRGCIPSKSYICSAKALKNVREAGLFGVEVGGEAKPDLGKIRERTQRIISNLENGIQHLLKSNGIEVINGEASLASTQKIRIDGGEGSRTDIESEKIIIAAGSSPAPLPAFQGIDVLTTDTVFNMEGIPSSLAIIGGGVVGCEFASIFSGFGSEVTILELESRLLPGEDPEIVKILEREFKKKKIKLLCGVKVVKAEERDGRKALCLEGGKEIEAEKILVSVGRRPNSSGLGLEGIGIALDPKGNIIVNERMETSVAGVYAIGDITGKWLLAHAASKEGIVAVENAMGFQSVMDYSAVPSAVFCDPEIGSVGLSIQDAEKKGFRVKTGTFSTRMLGKAQVTNELAGEVRLTIEEGSERLLGARIIGPYASELIHEAALAVSKGLTVRDMGETVHSHPTFSEAIMEAAWAGYKTSIHGGK